LGGLTYNKQLERTVIRRRVRAASAPFHYSHAARWTRVRAAAQLRRYTSVKRAIAAVVVGFGLSGCWPALKVVQPRAEVRVTGAAGEPIEGAEVTFVRADVFPGWHEVLGEYTTDATGTVKLPVRLKWHLQIMLPDAYTSYSWAYCVEHDGHIAVMAPLERWRRPSVAILKPSPTRSTCVLPNENQPFLTVSEDRSGGLSTGSTEAPQ
jgi:hypothetical protein